VNKVCFCFPFFLFFPGTGSSADRVCVVVSIAEAAPPDAGEAPPQTLVTVTLELPKIFINDTLPLTGNFTFAAEEEGSSGN
jgi:hypothetical protein